MEVVERFHTEYPIAAWGEHSQAGLKSCFPNLMITSAKLVHCLTSACLTSAFAASLCLVCTLSPPLITSPVRAWSGTCIESGRDPDRRQSPPHHDG